MGTIEFTEKAVKEYLDKVIMFWRLKKELDVREAEMCSHYIDAFQSVRTSLFGKTLPIGRK